MPINPRLINLHMALKYESYIRETTATGYLKPGERILINQERASIMANEFEYMEKYKQPPEINEKIKFIIDKLWSVNMYEVYYSHCLNLLKDE